MASPCTASRYTDFPKISFAYSQSSILSLTQGMNVFQDAPGALERSTTELTQSQSELPVTENDAQGSPKTKRVVSFWTRAQNMLYMHFLEENLDLFKGESHRRRVGRVYVQISDAVKTRTPDQCRSHHQKMVKWHKSVKGIIAHIRSLPEEKPRLRQREEQKKPVQSQVKLQAEPSYDSEEYRWLECINWMEWHQENWARRQNEEWLEGCSNSL